MVGGMGFFTSVLFWAEVAACWAAFWSRLDMMSSACDTEPVTMRLARVEWTWVFFFLLPKRSISERLWSPYVRSSSSACQHFC
jgi:hypothetical protein